MAPSLGGKAGIQGKLEGCSISSSQLLTWCNTMVSVFSSDAVLNPELKWLSVWVVWIET
jgi:hypothetical protein